MKLGEVSTVFLDTTFILPLFQVAIDVEGFTLEGFGNFLVGVHEAHVSELSIYEAKAKLFRLSTRDESYVDALESFGENLAVLRDDERMCLRPYTPTDDFRFNLMRSKNLRLDVFDAIIVAQSVEVGLLITEDAEILNLRRQKAFSEDPELGRLKIRRWKELER